MEMRICKDLNAGNDRTSICVLIPIKKTRLLNRNTSCIFVLKTLSYVRRITGVNDILYYLFRQHYDENKAPCVSIQTLRRRNEGCVYQLVTQQHPSMWWILYIFPRETKLWHSAASHVTNCSSELSFSPSFAPSLRLILAIRLMMDRKL